MKVVFDDNRIKIRKDEGVVLVLDRGDGISPELYEIVRDQARELDIPFKLGALSCKKELTTEGINGLNQKIQNRGRFIAPLMEGFFQQLPDRGYDLIILHSGCVYDLEDFSKEITVRFSRVIVKDINEQNNRTLEQWREIFKNEVFNFSIDDISLYFSAPAVPYEWSNDFTLSLDIKQRQFVLTRIIKEGVRKVDIELKMRGRGKSDIANIEIEANSSRFKGSLKNDKTFIEPQWKLLSKDDTEIFNRHIEKYKRSEFVIYCPLCNRQHKFERPFYCSEQTGDILAGAFSEGVVILKSVEEHQSGLILFKENDNGIKFLSTDKEILEFEEMRFVFISKGSMQVYEVKCNDISLEIKEAVKIYRNLYELEKGKMYVWSG